MAEDLADLVAGNLGDGRNPGRDLVRGHAVPAPGPHRFGIDGGAGLGHDVGPRHFTEALAVDDDGEPLDLTIRSFGVLRAVYTPPIDITIEPDDGPPVNGSDAVFAAVAAAVWVAQGAPAALPTGMMLR